MAYEPNIWESGEVITAEKLNNIERGVAGVNRNYEPTEWQCGDLFTAEKMNKIEQGIAEASSGEDVSVMALSVTQNGTYTAESGYAYSPIYVDIECGESVFVEPLNVTANGTYTAEAGTAYSPVSVNVPSDYSTAQVSIRITNPIGIDPIECKGLPYVYNNNILKTNPTSGGTYTVPLYKGQAECEIDNGEPLYPIQQITVGGSATLSGSNIVHITGDCTIVIELNVH